jgi:hypothetical protein
LDTAVAVLSPAGSFGHEVVIRSSRNIGCVSNQTPSGRLSSIKAAPSRCALKLGSSPVYGPGSGYGPL